MPLHHGRCHVRPDTPTVQQCEGSTVIYKSKPAFSYVRPVSGTGTRRNATRARFLRRRPPSLLGAGTAVFTVVHCCNQQWEAVSKARRSGELLNVTNTWRGHGGATLQRTRRAAPWGRKGRSQMPVSTNAATNW